ncbi:dihydrodipicolinate synthase family protein [Plantactinospora sp. BB1]|uniref:dihydrodipicolinate synthase family protein n=1 Tax=Plantactinospora sp. BB1 TaxID=2071627 RepID=UPI000D173B58|nr:dihydrodipicolinate synthase family protein [Plantactinospora sp. BB1]AVT40539.1 4-hydroxy-tetrahydrodipicolinate synthase [Plantactinospora sp. BB1]
MTFSGVYVPLITPFDATGAVALDALDALTHQVLAAGAAGVVALGTTGEPASLNVRERQAVVDAVARVCRERNAPLIVGANAVEAVEALPRRAEVVAALSVVPPFLRPGEAGVLAHFASLAAASPVPLVVYHVPYRTGQHLGTDAIRRLAELPGVAGIKYSVGAIDGGTVELLAEPPPDFAVLGGDDTLISALLALGAHGGILASAHLGTAAFVELAEAWRAGDTARARWLGHRLAALSTALFAEPNPTVIKAVLHAQGRIPTPSVRLPLVRPGPEAVRAAARLAQDDGWRTLSLQGLA